MSKKNHLILLAPLALLVTSALAGCDSSSEATRVLRVLNAEDYIYEYEEGDEIEMGTDVDPDCNEYKMDMLDQFILNWEANNPGETLEVVYDCYDTNETMFNELQTGKTTYDVIIPSDYMVQKLANTKKDNGERMLHKLTRKDELWENISPYLQESLETVKINDSDDTDVDYCVPYMWGTLGIMYNPQYYIDNCGFADEDEVHEFFNSWDALYSERSTGTFSIKDSVRDTYTICIIHALEEQVKNSTSSLTLSGIINDSSEDTIAIVKEDMLDLKENAFGFECDSGKTDMTTQKIGANLCWSGDATWAITEAEDNDLSLYYSLPIGDAEENRSASNIWFDCFCMPNNGESEEALAQYDLAQDFIEFMSRPENAAQNSYCVGYTPAVYGDEMLSYMRDCYDIENLLAYAIDEEDQESIDYYQEMLDNEEYVDYDLSYFFGDCDGDEIFKVDPDTAMRQMRAQYPAKEDLDRLGIMQDFGVKGNQALLDMWESVRTNPLPGWAIALFVCEGAIILVIAALILTKQFNKKRFQKARKMAR